MLRHRIARIFSSQSSLSLPPWPLEVKKSGKISRASERRYNEQVASKDDSFVCLDRKLIHTEQHPGGIESCDLLGPGYELIHVKRLDDSVSASHLFGQALVSAEALRSQSDAQAAMRDRVVQQSNGARTLPVDYRPRKVVLAFAGRAATPEALFTFSQVTLNRCAKRLGEMDIDLEITQIPYTDDVLEGNAYN
jgi:uncharacterized protein (TIGR04141 family)